MIELTEAEKMAVDALTEERRQRYFEIREKDTGHKMAMIIVSKEGPAGRVKGSRFPCPKKGTTA